MIRFLKGKFYPSIDGTSVIETSSGIGFLVTIPSNSPLYSHYDGEDVKVYTHMVVSREGDMSLYGFSSMDELELFKQLITVSGVGAKAGIAIMSVLPVEQLKHAIAKGDAKTIAKAQGVGKRTSERVILELQDKVNDTITDDEGIAGEEPAAAVIQGARAEAVEGLMALGFTRDEAETAVGSVAEEDLSVEEYITRALRKK
ncbi:MAG: Holliday junction branch migration protein RuvA [Anaerovoracaceae bacterium]|jgi:Holliday junction DNA helicase RuvA